ncbi:MAG: hypothetical protein ACRC8C_01685 [Mycoplasmoidaceae bacterium]
MNKKIKLTLLGALITSSALAITLPIVSCSSKANELSVISSTITKAQKIVTDALEVLIQGETSKTDQEVLAGKWTVKSDIPITPEIMDLIKAELKFEAPGEKIKNGEEVIEKITFLTPTTIGAVGSYIDGPKLLVELKPEYNSLKPIELKVNLLGKVKPLPLPLP